MSELILPPRPFCDVALGRPGDLDADVAVFGAPHGTPYPSEPVSHSADAPRAIRDALDWFAVGRQQIDMDLGRPVMGRARVADLGDLPDAGALANRAAIHALTRAILGAGAVPLMLGGDDSVPIPFLAAFDDRPVVVAQVDAHLDWRDEIEGERMGFSSTMRRTSEMAHVTRIVQIGARGPGSARAEELAAAEAYGARIVPMRALAKGGLAAAIAQVPPGAEIVLTIDADALDPALCPGVILPAHGGIGYQTMLDLFEGLAARGRIVGAAIVEYVPGRDPTGIGARALARLACCLIGTLVP